MVPFLTRESIVDSHDLSLYGDILLQRPVSGIATKMLYSLESFQKGATRWCGVGCVAKTSKWVISVAHQDGLLQVTGEI
jgi:hypothetical protein